MTTARKLGLGMARSRIFAGALLAGTAGLFADGSLYAQQQPEPARKQFRFQEQVEEEAEQPREAAPVDAPEAGPVTELQAYTIAPDRLEEVTLELQKKYIRRKDVQINVNKRVQQMIVTAPVAVHEEIAAFLAPDLPEEKALPAPKPVEQRALPPAAARVRGTHPLRNISAEDFEIALARIWNNRASFTTSHDRKSTLVKIPFGAEGLVSLTIDHERDLVTIDMPRTAQDSWRQVLKAIDSPRRAGGIQSELVALNRAEPDKVQKALELIRSVTLPFLAGDGPKQHIGQFVSMIFQPEPAAGAAQPAAAQPPAEAPPAGERPAGENAAGGEAGMEGEDAKIGPVRIEYIEGLDIFLIFGKKRDVERVQKIIAQIEAESEKTKPEVEIYMMEHVDDQAMAAMINQIYTPALGARQGNVTVVPLVKPNALLLIGRRTAIDSVTELIKKIDQPVAPNKQLRIFKLKYLSAIDAETKLRMFFTDRPGQGTTLRTGLGTRALIIADYRSNSLIVQASPRDMEEAAHILDSLDVDQNESGVKNEIRVFRLKNSLADELIQVIQESIYAQQLQQSISQGQGQGQGQNINQQGGQGAQGGQGGGAGTPTRAVASPKPTQLIFQNTNKTGVSELLESGILSDMRVAADPRANALVVTGPASSMDLMAALIEQLDGLPMVSAQVKIFRLIESDATQMATMLTTLFGQQTNQQQGGVQGFQSATSSGESTLVPLKFSVDTRTNSIIASGNAGDLAVVYRVLVGLDEKDLRGRLTSVYMLKNTTAEPVATAINQYLTNRQQLNTTATNLVSPVTVWDQAIIVVPEAITNSLIVNASPRYAEDIKKIIQQLDQRKNMVAIQVLIAEVKLSDSEQFGVELGLQDSLLFDRGIGTVGFPFNQAGVGNNSTAESLATRNAAASQGLSNLGVGRTDAALGYGGLVLSASSDSVNVLIRALQQSSRLQILSRPQIQTLDNQEANIQVGAEVRLISGTTITNGIAQNSVTPVEIGIILQVTPRTNADGNIIMFVDVSKSELGPEAEGTTIQGATPTQAPVKIPQIKKTVASTTVNTRSGQTVILGGLITNNQAEITRRVPYLGDIPVLGRLFRFDSKTQDRTELLIIMTPYIIQSDEQQNWLNQRESERMGWCLADVANIHGEVPYLTSNDGAGGTPSPLIFPDENPSVPEGVLPPPAPGIAPPPRGPISPPLSNGQRRGPQLEPINLGSPPGVPASYEDGATGNTSSARRNGITTPTGAGVIGTSSPPAEAPSEPTPAAPPRTAGTAPAKTRTIPKSRATGWPWQNQMGRMSPPPKLSPSTTAEVEPAGYAEPGQQNEQPVERAYR
ncbi:MAG: secretin N-terminal domain-containing protein [Pirellulaceae bacterium]